MSEKNLISTRAPMTWSWRKIFLSLSLLMGIGLSMRGPRAVTIEDEAYYLGHAHAIAHGRIVPQISDPYPGMEVAGRPRIKYPVAWPLLLAPAVKLGVAYALRMNTLIHLLAAGLFALLLRRRNLPPEYSFLFLLQPGLFFYSQTAMADSLTVLLILAGLLQCEKGRLLAASLWMGLAILIKIGAVVPAGIMSLWLAFEGVRGKRPFGDAWKFVGGLVFAGGLLLLGYKLTQGKFLPETYLARPSFSWISPRFAAHLGFYALGLVLIYPGMLWGLRYNNGLERFLVLSIVVFQSGYFFVDRGRSFLESLVLAQRLVLPAVAILLLGYASWMERLAKFRRVAQGAVGVAALGAALAIGTRYHVFQQEWSGMAGEIDQALPPGAFLEYDPRAMKLASVLSHPGAFLPLFPDQVHPEKETRYYLASKESLTYRAPEELPTLALPGNRVLETSKVTLWRIDSKTP